jgi:hypothetical protein
MFRLISSSIRSGRSPHSEPYALPGQGVLPGLDDDRTVHLDVAHGANFSSHTSSPRSHVPSSPVHQFVTTPGVWSASSGHWVIALDGSVEMGRGGGTPHDTSGANIYSPEHPAPSTSPRHSPRMRPSSPALKPGSPSHEGLASGSKPLTPPTEEEVVKARGMFGSLWGRGSFNRKTRTPSMDTAASVTHDAELAHEISAAASTPGPYDSVHMNNIAQHLSSLRTPPSTHSNLSSASTDTYVAQPRAADASAARGQTAHVNAVNALRAKRNEAGKLESRV